jgi:metal-sulfur cluster biosynthetic enzyme
MSGLPVLNQRTVAMPRPPASASPEPRAPSRENYPVPEEGRVGPLWDALREVMDPEIPISLVDLGLIYEVQDGGDGVAKVDLTFTASGCPCVAFIRMDVEEALLAVEGIERVEIEEVWNPPWTRARVSAAGRETLKKFGVAI